MSFKVFDRTYSSFLIFFNLCAAVTTLSVPPLTSLFLLSGTIAHDPIKSLSWLRTKHVHGNSPGLASPFCFPLISLNLLSPHLFSPCRMFLGSVSRHCWSQNTFFVAGTSFQGRYYLCCLNWRNRHYIQVFCKTFCCFIDYINSNLLTINI